MVQLAPDGSWQTLTLGPDILCGQHCQVLVPAGTWQGAFIPAAGKFALMGGTVAPCLDFADYERGKRETLLRQYPAAAEFVNRLT
jgi:predicted cupin superfamily sugar epimerase